METVRWRKKSFIEQKDEEKKRFNTRKRYEDKRDEKWGTCLSIFSF